MDEWEYLMREIDASANDTKSWTIQESAITYKGRPEINSALDTIGKKRWELVSAMPCSNERGTYRIILFFKRRVVLKEPSNASSQA